MLCMMLFSQGILISFVLILAVLVLVQLCQNLIFISIYNTLISDDGWANGPGITAERLLPK